MTLIEILVVIAIIAIISTIGFLALRGGTRSADDTSRIADLTNLAVILESRKSELGHYPKRTTCTDVRDLVKDASSTEYMEDGGRGKHLAPGQKLPFDDDAEGQGYFYVSNTEGTDYRLITRLEDPENRVLNTDSQKEIRNLSSTRVNANSTFHECQCDKSKEKRNYCVSPDNV